MRPRPTLTLWICVLLVGASLVAFVSVLIIYLSNLGYPVGNSDEAIYAEFIRSMQQTGDYFQLRYDGHVTLQRPPETIAFYALISRVLQGKRGCDSAPPFSLSSPVCWPLSASGQ